MKYQCQTCGKQVPVIYGDRVSKLWQCLKCSTLEEKRQKVQSATSDKQIAPRWQNKRKKGI